MEKSLRSRIQRTLGSFPARIYVCIVGPLIGFGAVLTALFIQTQSRMLEDHLGREAAAVASVIAHDVRVGVFSENRALLADVTEGAAGRPEVLAVAVFNDRLNPLQRRWGSAADARSGWIDERYASRALAGAPRPTMIEGRDRITFWAPVYTRGAYASGENLYFSDAEPQRPRVGGLVAVMISKRPLAEGRRALATRSLLVLGGGTLLAALVSFLAVREASRPLSRLLERVKGLNLPARTSHDDVNVLSDSFGHLVQSLREAFREVAEANETLERRVSERTAELAAANAELTLARDHLEERIRERTLELENTHRQLLHAEKMSAVGRISASLAHEINNPVFAVRNVLDGLKTSKTLNDHDLTLVRAASDECTRVARLIRDLQSFNRPTSAVRAVVQIESVLDGVLLLCSKELSVKKVTVETAYAPRLPSVWGVADQLKQVFLNLFTNAMDAMSAAGGTLSVSAEAANGEVVVRVRDTGAGIAEEDLDHIFEPFFTTKPEVKGTGLGLSISSGIIQNHGGSIHVESRPGAGTTFTVRLPIPTGEIS